jgi:dihydrolipoamide dehydrogenase
MVVGEFTEEADLLVIGGGPGGYSAAIRASQLGRSVTLVEHQAIGGVCLNVGCIPSKALIELSARFHALEGLAKRGVVTEDAHIDPVALADTVRGSVERLTSGVRTLLKGHGVEVLEGWASFAGPTEVRVAAPHETKRLTFRDCILATGSVPRALPGIEVDHELVLDSTDLLFARSVLPDLLVIGGGYIGVELGSAHARLGTRVTLVEVADDLLMGVEREHRRLLRQRLEALGMRILTSTEVREASIGSGSVRLAVRTPSGEETLQASAAAVLVGRVPALPEELGLGTAGIAVREGRVTVDAQLRTTNPHVYAIGDIAPGPMLAHKAYYEAKVAAEAASGLPSGNDATVIPAVVFSEPEIASAGLGEEAARAAYGDVVVARFPYRANGRAIVLDASVGEVKLIAERASGRLLGAHVIGEDASNLISEAALAIEFGATLEDLALTIHPHPTLSEMWPEAAEVGLDRPTHVLVQSRSAAPR